MTYRTVMVNLVVDQPNERCIAVASDLAERFEARIIGIAAADFSPPLYFTTGAQAERLLEESHNAIKTSLGKLEAEFFKLVGRGAKSVEWRSSVELPTRYLARQARAADFIVMAQPVGNALIDPFERVNPNDLVMQAGRPLLLVPEGVSWLGLRSVLVAWKDSPESRRAIAAALPLLCAAERVTVAGILEESDDYSASLAGVKDVVNWLSCHGVAATEVVANERVKDVPGALEKVASNVGASIIVAGAYGHSRLREWVMGGVTRHLITSSTRCAFLCR